MSSSIFTHQAYFSTCVAILTIFYTFTFVKTYCTVLMIRFFMILSPFWTGKERSISSLYIERLSALFQIDSVPSKAAMPA